MYYTVSYIIDWFDGIGSACDEFVEQFTDLTDAIEFLHSVQYRPDREWEDWDNGAVYHNYETVVDARLTFASAT